jgi:predicted helicase
MQKIRTERTGRGSEFAAKFAAFHDMCKEAITKDITADEIEEMLVQHLLTERLFRTIFQNQEFTQRNVIAREIETVIQALTARAFNRAEFLSGLDRFYLAIELAAQTVKDYGEKQGFLNTVYERFFQGFAKYQADTFGIFYTPQPIVEFMCASVEEVLKQEFHRSLSDVGVQILDPCTGTGNFIVNLLQRISPLTLGAKYQHDLFANEIMLLPYYIASMNIEHAYHARMEQYAPFEGICFADTLNMEGLQKVMFSERNTERIDRERAAPLMVIIGNPPYNAGQQNENDNNKNREYPVIEGRIRATYGRDSRATNKNALDDPYIKFFRWATDRLQGRDGIVCFVSNNSLVHKLSLDGMRKHLAQDFTSIYHINLRGDANTSGELRRDEGGNVFNDRIRVGIGITLLVRNRAGTNGEQQPAQIFYYDIGPRVTSKAKQQFLTDVKSITGVQWQELAPDEETNLWLTEGMRPEFAMYIPIGSKAAKSASVIEPKTIFKLYSGGVKTNRDDWVYDFDRDALLEKIKRTVETYNIDVDRWRRRGNDARKVDDFVTYDDTRIKWSESLKLALQRGNYAVFEASRVRSALYRPFCKEWLFFDRFLNERVYQMPVIFPTSTSEAENVVINLTDVGSEKPFMSLMSQGIVDLHLVGAGSSAQCFSYYIYNEDGSNRRENITDWALAQFQERYGVGVTKRDVFHYVYAVLHHPIYRDRYTENLKRELPRIPLAPAASFAALVAAGQQLASLHTHYEQAQEYSLHLHVTKEPITWRVEKMRLTPDRSAIVYNDTLMLEGIPATCHDYRLGNRSALEWVIDQYRVDHDKRSNITTDPNRPDDPQYIAHLLGKVITVSMETNRIVAGLPDLGLREHANA